MSFDHLAPCYRLIETLMFGQALQDARQVHLDRLRSARRVLILGEGNGRFLAELLRRCPEVQVDCVDASAGMIAQARRRIGADVRVTFHHADARAWDYPPEAFDAVVTHFFLDCFEGDELAALTARIARAATPTAIWLVSDFRLPPTGLRRWRAWLWLTVMYRFFRWTTALPARWLEVPDRGLEACGFRCVAAVESQHGLLVAQAWQREPPPG